MYWITEAEDDDFLAAGDDYAEESLVDIYRLVDDMDVYESKAPNGMETEIYEMKVVDGYPFITIRFYIDMKTIERVGYSQQNKTPIHDIIIELLQLPIQVFSPKNIEEQIDYINYHHIYNLDDFREIYKEYIKYKTKKGQLWHSQQLQ